MILILMIVLAAAPAPNLSQLAWMAGCWEGPKIEEQWMKPAGGTMFGMSRTVADGKTVFSEFMQIREDKGEVVLSVQLWLAEKATPFKLIRASGTEAIFENPEHDFPQRIIYRKQPDGSLFARIEGKEKGKDRSVDFPLKRARCD